MESFPKCQVCQQYFKWQGPAPYLLPCLHAVCETCVTSTAGGVISCSTCHGEVNLTETHLQKDVVRQREIFHLTVQHRPSELLCTLEDDGNQAVCWCKECEELLCEYCQNLHEKFKATRKHVVQDIGDIQPGSQDHEEYCSIHTKYLLDTWDRSCNVLICGRCKSSDHAEHDLEDVSVAADAARLKIETQQKDVLLVTDRHNSLIQTTREQLKRTTETSNTLRDNISHTFQSLKSVLDQREKELHISLQQHTDQVTLHHDSKTKVTQSQHLRCQITSEYIQKALQYSTNCVLLKVKRTIEERTQTCLDSTTEQEDFPLPEFYTSGLDKVKTTLSSFGNIHPPKGVALHGRGNEDKASQTTDNTMKLLEELRQQKDKEVQNLQSELMNSEARIKDLQTSLTTLRRQKEAADISMKESRTRFEKTGTELNQLQVSLSQLTQEKPNMMKEADDMVDILRQNDIHVLKTDFPRKDFLLHCVQLKYDLQKVHRFSHINSDGELVNKADTTRPSGNTSDRFQNYIGTTSTVPLSKSQSLQYVELLSDVMIDKPLGERDLVLNTGICPGHLRDVHYRVPDRQYCYSLGMAQCPAHDTVCTWIWKDGKLVHHLRDTLPNTAGSHTTLHYGIVYDTVRGRMVFLDVKQMKVLGALDNVDYTQSMWPMFGVYNPRIRSWLYFYDCARIRMKLVVGNDIDMTPEKKALILKSL